MLKIFILLNSIFVGQMLANLMCNGDFQANPIYWNYYDSSHTLLLRDKYAPNNYECWYSYVSYCFEVKQIQTNKTSTNNVADFINVGHDVLCQTRFLKINQCYNIDFDFILDKIQTFASIRVTVNGAQIFAGNLTGISPAQTFNTQFLTTASQNQICFAGGNQTFQPSVLPQDTLQYGSMLDNVYLFQRMNVTVNDIIFPLSIQCGIDKSTFIFYTQLNPRSLGLQLSYFNNLIVQICSQKQSEVTLQLSSDNYLVIKVKTNWVYSVQNMLSASIYLPPQFALISCSDRLVFSTDNLKIKYSGLSELENKIVQIADNSAVSFTENVYSAYILMSTTPWSSLILGLVGFYNLGLMYTFLHISTVPSFANNFMYNLVQVFYRRNSTVGTIKKLAKVPQNQLLLDFKSLSKQQKLEAVKKGQAWFQLLGMSTNFMKNNIQSLLILFIFCLKCIIFKIVVKFLPQRVRNIVDYTLPQLFKLFNAEMLCLSPFFIVSIFNVFLLISEQNSFGIINNLLHFIAFSLIIYLPLIQMCLRLWSIRKFARTGKVNNFIRQPAVAVNESIPLKQKQSGKQNIQKQQKSSIKIYTDKQLAILMKKTFKQCIDYNYLECIQTTSHYLLCLLIPALTTVNNQVTFFTLTTPIIAFRLWLVIRNLYLYTIFEKVLKLSSTTLWLTYQLSFILLLFIQFFRKDYSQPMSGQLLNLIKGLGFLIIVCLILGGLIDLLKTLFNILDLLVRAARFISNKIKQIKNLDENSNVIYPLNEKMIHRNIFQMHAQQCAKEQIKQNKNEVQNEQNGKNGKNMQNILKSETLKMKTSSQWVSGDEDGIYELNILDLSQKYKVNKIQIPSSLHKPEAIKSQTSKKLKKSVKFKHFLTNSQKLQLKNRNKIKLEFNKYNEENNFNSLQKYFKK